MKALTDSEFKQAVEDFDGVALVDFWAEWCGPCHMLAPTIEDLAKKYESNQQVKIMKLDVDANPQTAGRFGIMSIPTVIVFKQGTTKKTLVGVRPEDDYREAIEQALEE